MMKRQFEQIREDEFYITTPLILAISDYNRILDEINLLKIYIEPENATGINYTIEENNKELFDVLDSQRLLALNRVSELLSQGHDPNVPMEVIKYIKHYYSDSYKKNSDKTLPLNLAKDKVLIELLLQFGANPNEVIHGTTTFRSQLRISFGKQEYFKMHTLVTYSPFKIEQKEINAIAAEMMQQVYIQDNTPNGYTSFVEKEYAVKTLNLLINQMNSKEFILDYLDRSTYIRRNAVNLFQQQRDKLDSLIPLLKYKYSQTLSLSIWMILKECLNQKNHLIATLPLDVLQLIMCKFYFINDAELNNKIYGRYLVEKKAREDEEEQAKFIAFKVIYTIMRENIPYLCKIIPIEFSEIRCYKELKKKIQDRKVGVDWYGYDISAWNLMHRHYDNLNISNQPLIDDLVQWVTDNAPYQMQDFTSKLPFFGSKNEGYRSYLRQKVIDRFNELVVGEMDSETESRVINTQHIK